ncbi:HNH endonuclease signature motif containing protein [Nocardioides zeae]|uniref:HNH endonuclease signature motif containing protein n=1 Tax=Nocardioides imazamoxiresistens TaxID=3231893 RepID=A0ABU3PSZ6_9ACTN|nr:HNH endonuclease signature motif containing protein [Nocardioides zeae]MDT9592351.1 HNH endonuclease signature motif containing protein [Nocardioides zeae]
MTAALDLVDRAPLPADVLGEVRAARTAADAAEVRILELALEWAYAHPAAPGAAHPGAAHPLTGTSAYVEPVGRLDEDDVVAGGWFDLPQVAWDAPAAFAAASGTTTAAGARLIRDVLQLAHRLPRTWAATRAGRVPAWRARRVADAVAGQPGDVAAYVDEHVHESAGTVGARTLARMVDEAMLRLHAEDRELEQLAELDRRHATLHVETLNHTGLVEMSLRGDYVDLAALDATLDEVADALADPRLADLVGLAGCATAERKGVRRSLAVGVLADPAAAEALLAAARSGEADARSSARPGKRAVVHLYLSEAGFLGLDPVARLGGAAGGSGLPVLVEQVRDWLARRDTHVTVRPVMDAASTCSSDRYEIPDRLRQQVLALHTTCIFPWCDTAAEACDLDHLDPWRDDGSGGATASDNLAPLCRHHHRLKTLAGWRVRRLCAGTYLWTDPHGRTYLRLPVGTFTLDPESSAAGRLRPRD